MRVGLVGAGVMGRVHAAGWAAAGAELVAVFSRDEDRARELAGQYGARVVGSYADLLREVDVVDICVPTHLHHDMALEAFSQRRHVVCEKPIALTEAEGREMIAAAERAGVRFFVAMVLRFFPQYRLTQELVAQGRIGQVGVIRLKRVSYTPNKPGDNWYLDHARSGGMIVDLMVHDFDFACWLAGDVTRVYARAAGDRYALATLRFANGAMALVEGGWANPPGVFRTAIDVAGTQGVIEWSSDSTATIRTFLRQPEGTAGEVGLPLSPLAEDPYTTQIKHAYEAIRTGADFAVTPEDALRALRVALAAKESVRTGRSVSLQGG
ncbi:MAG TPA: Gfo/Idh/MocA family oxidoreductase [Limnochordales bacterium]